MGRKSQASEQGASGQTRDDLKTRSHSSSSQAESSELKKAARRTVFTPQQLYYLEERFVENQFPDADQRERIATHLNLTSQHVQVEFNITMCGTITSIVCIDSMCIFCRCGSRIKGPKQGEN